mmetsp:Transcript_48819/g.86233  ORF Transcript_48819/g.86233 Transcript_48819/m.86233 type:complete len:80 (-) Transcript_48819:137-376(-)
MTNIESTENIFLPISNWGIGSYTKKGFAQEERAQHESKGSVQQCEWPQIQKLPWQSEGTVISLIWYSGLSVGGNSTSFR